MHEIFHKANLWADSLKHESGLYSYSSEATAPSLYATCYRVMLSFITQDISTWPLDKRFLVSKAILSCRNKDGFFYEPDGKYCSNKHNLDYTKWHLTMCAVHALAILDPQLQINVSFMNSITSPSALDKLIHSLKFKNSWNTSNVIMSVCSLLIFAHNRTENRSYLDSVHYMLDMLESFQDSKSGLWGTDYGASLVNSMAGTYHYLMFYYYLGRPIPHHQKLIKSTLLLQAPSGHFGVCGASACLDLDGLDIIAHGSTSPSLRTGINASLECQTNSGGFTESSPRLYPSDMLHLLRLFLIDKSSFVFNIKLLIKFSFLRKKHYYGGSLTSCGSQLLTPNMWATFGRIAAIVSCKNKLHINRNDFASIPLPTLGFFRHES